MSSVEDHVELSVLWLRQRNNYKKEVGGHNFPKVGPSVKKCQTL